MGRSRDCGGCPQGRAQASEQELVAHVATQLASYKKPQQVIFVQEIAKTAVGKLNRRAMRERLKPQ
jgi:acyl-coenzyme A synthetase/AMP-(fatty) acid ligase